VRNLRTEAGSVFLTRETLELIEQWRRNVRAAVCCAGGLDAKPPDYRSPNGIDSNAAKKRCFIWELSVRAYGDKCFQLVEGVCSGRIVRP